MRRAYQTDHASFQSLEHPPEAVDILGEHIACQAHAGIISLLDGVVFGVELEHAQDRGEHLFPGQLHIVRDAGQDRGRHEVARGPIRTALPLARAHDDLCALGHRILMQLLRFVQAPRRGHGTHRRAILDAVSNLQLLGLARQQLHKLVMHPGLHVDPVRRDARLPGMPPLERHELPQRLLEIRIVEHDKRAVPAELERHLLQVPRAQARDDLADPRAARERDLFDQRVQAQRLGHGRRVVQARGQHVERAGREPGARREAREAQRGDGRLGARLDDHGTPRRERGARLAQHHGDGEVPRAQGGGDAERLLDDEHAAAGGGGRVHGALDAVRLAREPPGEAEGVVELAVGLGEGLARLVDEDAGQVVARRDQELVPFHQQLGAPAGRVLAVGEEGLLRGLDCGVDVFGLAVWARRPYLAGARVLDVEALVGSGPGPLPVDEALGFEEVFV